MVKRFEQSFHKGVIQKPIQIWKVVQLLSTREMRSKATVR